MCQHYPEILAWKETVQEVSASSPSEAGHYRHHKVSGDDSHPEESDVVMGIIQSNIEDSLLDLTSCPEAPEEAAANHEQDKVREVLLA